MKWDLWLLFGFLAEGIFFLRFFVQWIFSELAGKSLVPVSFWYISLLGGAMLTVYAVHIEDPVFILGQGLGLLVYLRNLVLIKKDRKRVVMKEGLSNEDGQQR